MKEYTVEEVGAHNARDDLWVIIHGKVYNITNYVRDHPGGADVLIDVAGTDATAAYEDVGHSEDANEILETYLIGSIKNAQKFVRKHAVRVIKPVPTNEPKRTSPLCTATVLSLATGGPLLYHVARQSPALRDVLHNLTLNLNIPSPRILAGGFPSGFLAATAISTALGSIIATKLSAFTRIESGFTRYPPRIKSRGVKRPNPHLMKGFLSPKDYKALPLIRKDQLSATVYRFVFALPNPNDVLGLPIGQHVAIKALVNGTQVSRSYTPISNNLDTGRIELIIKCYPDGLLTGTYLANLQIGDSVLFRGPKGAMRYSANLCKRIGMIAGGTGITPMYQLIRAICEDETDTTEVSLVYANRTEEDILLRGELEAFARRYPRNLKIWYMLDHPPAGWAFGSGYVTPQVMRDRLPGPAGDVKIMLCGPPGMVSAAKRGLVGAGFEQPGAVGKMSDQIFCF
ncbi:hypothetical protein BDV25DRAFT_169379 [Aspergillus avenaceus]|uniref:Uncharacterized protein n=1 Tax=Aspergillus avenaceus TaxID=36643 RepID=A0A5N6TLB4_ASPAV|nr:hypothetical protein BDV25DRAFT_169379 [Aspergillus avenaceus]